MPYSKQFITKYGTLTTFATDYNEGLNEEICRMNMQNSDRAESSNINFTKEGAEMFIEALSNWLKHLKKQKRVSKH